MKKSTKPYGGKLTALDSIFGEQTETAAEFLETSQIVVMKGQPRHYFDPTEQASLVESIKQHGILQPLLVRPLPSGKYELVAGERRYRAAKTLNLKEVPAVIKELNNEQAHELALLENLQREDLNPLEETEGILNLLATRLNTNTEAVISLLNQASNAKREITDNVVRKEEWLVVEATFKTIGRLTPEAFRTHRLPLLSMHEDILEALRHGKLHYTKARLLASIKVEGQRAKLLEKAIEDELSLNELKAEMARLKPKSKADKNNDLASRIKKHLSPNKLEQLPTKKRQAVQALLRKLDALLTE
jgi:ParB family transcriptional regulator, chromosome partitioning protein